LFIENADKLITDTPEFYLERLFLISKFVPFRIWRYSTEKPSLFIYDA